MSNGTTHVHEMETRGLIPAHISSQQELNEWEQLNILEAQKWAFSRRRNSILTVEFLTKLHRKMFDKTWDWAGQFRKTSKNVGIEPAYVALELRQLVEDTQYQVENQVYPIDEIAARFHHKLVWVHPFANGNGRHGRLATDIFLVNHDRQRFSWGRYRSTPKEETRKAYIQALREADQHNITPLLDFVRS